MPCINEIQENSRVISYQNGLGIYTLIELVSVGFLEVGTAHASELTLA